MASGGKKYHYKLVLWALCVLFYAVLQTNTEEPATTPRGAEVEEAEEQIENERTGTRAPEVEEVKNPEEEKEEEKQEEKPNHEEKKQTPLTAPTWRPPRMNCTPPAIEQFPKPFIGPYARKHGALIIHILICIYSFIGLAIVCDDYFVTTLDRICEELKLSPDVAGATFMAAGSSAPELATVVIGVFFAKDDIGVSGVIGSAVFNIMFVISICALFAGTVSYLNWWPLSRDCFFYSISILIMICVIYDETITWGESLFMLFAYVGYCVMLAYNPALERWAQTLPVPCKQPIQESEDTHLVSYKSLEEKQAVPGAPQQPPSAPTAPAQYANYNTRGGETNMAMSGGITPTNSDGTLVDLSNQNQNQHPQNQTDGTQKKVPEYYKATTKHNQAAALLKPETEDKLLLFQWYACFPIHYFAQKTMPDLTTEKYRNWYPFTFLVSMIWISFYSYFMVWMITLIGTTLGIPDTVMGLTFVAAGVSVPDALSSLAVVKEGYSDMAVSNAVGSNVFDILICLGLPWFLQTGVFKPGSQVHVYSKGLIYSTVSLLSTVIFLIVATHLNGWKLDKKYGIVLMLWYLFFICVASLYELNVFGDMNPPECGSDY